MSGASRLPLRGSTVTAVHFGETVTFVLDSAVCIVVGAGACFTAGPIRAPDADVRTLAQWGRAALARSVGARVVSAVGFESGALRVVFDSGWHLDVRSTSAPFVPAAVATEDGLLWVRAQE